MAKGRPILRWHGGKFLLAPWIISNMPAHRIYVEPFGGAGSVLLRKPRCYAEIYNDIDDGLYNLFWVLRNEHEALACALGNTPFSRREFEMAHVKHPDPVENARRLIIRSFMGFGADSASNTAAPTGFRSNSNRSGSTPAHDWSNYPTNIAGFHERFKGVVLEHRDAFEVMVAHDSPETLHYVDPPYVFETRKRVGAYKHEFSEHERLIEFLKTLKGKVMLSGYRSSLYESAMSDWRFVEREALADGALKRIEVLWMNFPAAELSLQLDVA